MESCCQSEERSNDGQSTNEPRCTSNTESSATRVGTARLSTSSLGHNLRRNQSSNLGNGLFTNDTITNHDHLANGWDALHADEDECRSRSEDVRVGWELRDVQDCSVVISVGGVR